MSDGTYNGWANYPTWAVNMWLTNSEVVYDYCLSMADTGRGRMADAIKDMVRDECPDIGASMYSDLMGWAIDSVDWFEIADSFIEEEVEA